MRTNVLFLIALMVQTAVYCVAVYQSNLDYVAWTKAETRLINELLPEGQTFLVTYGPYLTSLHGKLAFSFGAALASSWIFLGVSILLSDRKETSQN